MSICLALGIMLGRGIQSLYVDIKKKWETKQQQKREQQRVFEQPRGSTRVQPSIQTERGEYQYLNRGEEIPRHGHTRHHLRHDRQNNPQLDSAVAPLQSLSWLDIEVDPLEDTLPTYDPGAAWLPPYDPNPTGGMSGSARRGRRQGRRPCGNEPVPRARACTGMRIREYDVGGAVVIWYDALEDRYEVISITEPPPYINLIE